MMLKSISKILSILLLSLTLSFSSTTTSAQCPMCKMSAEQNLKDGGTAGKGLNAGILYMLSTPYLIVAGLGIYWYRNRRKENEEEVPNDNISYN